MAKKPFKQEVNSPALWGKVFPWPNPQSHKYERGHTLIYGAPELTGATRLAAAACARIGSGLVSVLSDPSSAAIYRASLAAQILVRESAQGLDSRITARLYGCGGLMKGVRLRFERPCVLDAEALLCLPERMGADAVLTPHEGEFARAFPDLRGNRVERALGAAQKTGAIVVLKGPETIIAGPEGRVVCNTHASPFLASAGTGDVLAGLIAGLLAQGMPAFLAACAGVWIHGDSARRFGPGLVASDLPDMVPAVLRNLMKG